MMESRESLPIVYETETNYFSFWLPVSICNNLSLDYESKDGILIWHKQKDKLEALAIKIITLDNEAKTLRDKGKYAQRRKVLPAAVVLFALIIAVFFTETFFKTNPSLRLPLSLVGAVIAVYCCFILFKNYSFPDLYDQGTDTLKHRMALIEIQKQIKQDFASPGLR